MMYNQSSNKIEWGHMKMPEIIIDFDNESALKIYDKEPYNNRFLDTQGEELNRLSCKSNLDDVDSGIHESNDTFLPGITPVLHSNRLSLRDMKKRSNLSEVRSYSTNCIPVECNMTKEGLGINDARLCRNCSTKTYSKRQFDSSKRDLWDNQYSIKEPITQSEPKPKTNSKDSLQHKLCRIRVLLVCMKIVLGATMTYLGFFLLSISDSIKIRDCAFWASGPLFVSGLYEALVYHLRKQLKRKLKMCYLMTIICGILSLVCSILCLLSSIFSGIHGNWISGHSDNCKPDDNEEKKVVLSACCFNRININLNSSLDSCICREARSNISSPTIETMIYNDLNCRYVFSAVKDYLILQCALMGIGSGVCLWLLQMTIQRIMHDCAMGRQIMLSSDLNEEQNCVGQSPVIPLKIRCIQTKEKSQQINDLIREKSLYNQSFNQQTIRL